MALSELEEFRDDEIAEILGVTIHTAKIRLHRARARLKKELEAHCNFYRDERNEFACDQKASSSPKIISKGVSFSFPPPSIRLKRR